jgi:hypothetical protein
MQFFFANLETQVTSLGTRTVVYASLILIICTIIALVLKNRVPRLKLPLFLIMATTLIGSTLILFGSTIYLNTKSESKGPVHWHAEVEFWACGTELELRDPDGFLSNKIGTSTYHEHNDKHLHLEGVVVRKADDASLEKFMQVSYGFLTDESIGVALNDDNSTWFTTGEQTDGDAQSLANAEQLKTYVAQSDRAPVMRLKNGALCGSKEAELQVFVYKYNKAAKTYRQEKLAKPTSYLMSEDSSLGPPSDCVIVEFDEPKERTNKLCEQYGVKDASRCMSFGVEEFDPGQCHIRDATTGGRE